MNDFTIAQYLAYANYIAGTWYSEIPDEMLVFSFLYDYMQESDMLIKEGNNCLETTYSIQNVLENDWLLVVWNKRENKTAFYHIKLLNPDMLVLLTRNHQVKVYSRKINTGFLNNTFEE